MGTLSVKACVAPAARFVTVREKASGMSAPGGLTGTRVKPTTKLPVASPPPFFSVYITLRLLPGATPVTVTLPLVRLAAGVNVTDCTVRSGRTTLRITADRKVLLVSSASTTALAGSAMKRSLYRPAEKSGGRAMLLLSEAEVAPAL